MRDTLPRRAVDPRQISSRPPADAGLDGAVGTLGVDLAEQVDLDRGVDRDEARDRGDSGHVVGVRDVGQPQRLEPCREVVEAGVAEHHAGRDARVGVDRAGFPQCSQCARDHAGVDAQAPVRAQRRGQRQRHRTDTELERVAVAHECRDMAADARLDVADGRLGEVEQRRLGLDARIELGDMDAKAAARVLHARIQVCDALARATRPAA